MTQHDQERATTSSASAQAVAGLAGLAEAWLRDTAFCGVWLFSLVVVVCGFGAPGAGYAALGLVAGVLAGVLPTVAVVRKAPAARIWLAILAGVAVDAAALAVVLAA